MSGPDREYDLAVYAPGSPEDVLTRLFADVDRARYSPFPFSGGFKGHAPFIGRVTGTRFWLGVRHSSASGYFPRLRGTVEAVPGGSRLVGRFAMDPGAKVVTNVVLLAIVAGSLWALLLPHDPRTTYVNPEGLREILLFTAVFWLFVVASRYFTGDERRIREFVATRFPEATLGPTENDAGHVR